MFFVISSCQRYLGLPTDDDPVGRAMYMRFFGNPTLSHSFAILIYLGTFGSDTSSRIRPSVPQKDKCSPSDRRRVALQVKSSEQELRQTSLLVLPLLLALGVAYARRSQLLAGAGSLAAALAPARPARAPARAPALDRASIDHIVSSVNAAGKKQAKKKAQ